MGPTGVPVCGDPGWAQANRNPSSPVDYQRDFYPKAPTTANADDCNSVNPRLAASFAGPVAAGRKRLYWYAEDVTISQCRCVRTIAMKEENGATWQSTCSTSRVTRPPGGTYRGETYRGRAQWLDSFFGKFAWPDYQRAPHRRRRYRIPHHDSDGSADQGLIVHELGHNYVMGNLANNEWKEGFLDEGFTSFQESLFNGVARNRLPRAGRHRTRSRRLLRATSLVSEELLGFHDLQHHDLQPGYRSISCVQSWEIPPCAASCGVLRPRLEYVDEQAFMEVAEEVSHRDLSDFGQWLHSNGLVHYAAGKGMLQQIARRRWRSRIEVFRRGPGMVPVDVAAINGKDTTGTDGPTGRDRAPRSKPKEVVVDPARTHD